MGTTNAQAVRSTHEDFVEIMLLLGASRLEALVNLSQGRGQSVGQLVRGLIERELSQSERLTV
jgi:hypothetical protein